MTDYNLLPYQETLCRKKQNTFIFIWGCIFLGSIIMLVAWHVLLQRQNTTQLVTLKQLQRHLGSHRAQKQLLEITQQKLNTLQQQIYTINTVENNQKYNLELLSLISKSAPAMVRLDVIEKNNNTITIKGSSYTLAAIAEFMQKIGANPRLKTPSLQEITNADDPTLPEKKFCITIRY